MCAAGLVSFDIVDRRDGPPPQAALPVEPNSSVGVAAASEVDDTLYYSVEGFLDPTHLWRADAATGASTDIKDLPARFDASGDAVDQYEATSTDGTRIPYFVVHPKAMKLDGTNPTLLYAYGGFQVSDAAELFGLHRQALAGARRRLCAGQHPRRRRIRAGLARGGPEDPPPADLSTTSPPWRRT